LQGDFEFEEAAELGKALEVLGRARAAAMRATSASGALRLGADSSGRMTDAAMRLDSYLENSGRPLQAAPA